MILDDYDSDLYRLFLLFLSVFRARVLAAHATRSTKMATLLNSACADMLRLCGCCCCVFFVFFRSVPPALLYCLGLCRAHEGITFSVTPYIVHHLFVCIQSCAVLQCSLFYMLPFYLRPCFQFNQSSNSAACIV